MTLSKDQIEAAIQILNTEYMNLERVLELPRDQIHELDLGCGNGGFTTQLAACYPDRIVLAADVMLGRLRKLVKRTLGRGVRNVRPLRIEARNLVAVSLPDRSMDRIHVICPDPWPRHKHRPNRLMASEFLGHLHRVLKPNRILHFATDETRYFETVSRLCDESSLFLRDDSAISDVIGMKSQFEIRWNELGMPVLHAAWRTTEVKR
jgi:tRNA (guanine-N7-)-methyltransferase